MAVKKIAISIPEDVLAQVDRLAKRTKTTRSGCIAKMLSAVAYAGAGIEITERINELFSDPKLANEQTETSNVFLRAAEKAWEDSEW